MIFPGLEEEEELQTSAAGKFAKSEVWVGVNLTLSDSRETIINPDDHVNINLHMMDKWQDDIIDRFAKRKISWGLQLPFQSHLIYRLPQILEISEKWGVDMLRISELTDKKTLMCVTYTIFQERDLIKTFKIPAKVFLNFLRTLEDHYLQVNTLNTMLNSSDCLFQLPRFA